jgi:glycosyltransferase involved in cell wall biosynthesis
VGLPVYNAERYLAQAVDSILGQDFTDLELIISDNASTDSTVQMCREYAAEDPRVRIVEHKTNRGVAFNFNCVVERARGELFRWAAYDDLLEPDLIRRCVEELDRSGPRAVLAYPQTVLIDDSGSVVEEYEDNLDVRQRTPWARVACVTMNWNLCNPLYGVIRTAELRRTGLQRAFVSADVPLLYELAAIGEFHEVPGRMFLRRFHSASSSGRAAGWYRPDRPRAEWFPEARLVVRSVRVLLTMDQSLPVRLTCTITFVAVWGYRTTRVHGGSTKAWLRGLRSSHRGRPPAAD